MYLKTIYTDEELKRLSDETMSELIAKSQEEINSYQNIIGYLTAIISELQAELDRRELATYWGAHPGLRLEPGDFVLRSEPIQIDLFGKLGRISFINRNDNTVRIEPVNGGGVHIVPLSFAREIRRAYLVRESEQGIGSSPTP